MSDDAQKKKQEEEDIARFADIGNAFQYIKQETDMDRMMRNTMQEVMARSAIYLEFLAGAFLKETGLKASEAELIMETIEDPGSFSRKIKWYFQKRGSNG
jgi:hypothetical protein